MAFADLGLLPALARALQAQGLRQPTPVQAQAIPAALAGGDVLARAPTGSGKTLAYALPLLQRLAAQGRRAPRLPWALVLVPTRELATQVADTVQALAPALTLAQPLKLVTAVGGLSINPQMMALRGGADVVVATPGRLLDLVDHNALVLGGVALLVLDEADRLLDEGFAAEIQRVLALVPRRRQTLLLSATFPPAVQALADGLLQQPRVVRAEAGAPAGDQAPGADQDAGEPAGGDGGGGDRAAQATAAPGPGEGATPGAPGRAAALAAASNAASPSAGASAAAGLPAALAAIHQRALQVDVPRRTALLRELLKQHRWPRVLVFVATQHATEHVADKLRAQGITAAPLHGQLSTGARHAALSGLQAGTLQVVVATDLAARGLHIPALDAVVNYDLPRAAADHVHRIGRTGRAGASGVAISFVTATTEAHFRLIEKRQGLRVPREVLPGFEPTETAPETASAPGAEAPGSGGVKGKRPSKKDKLRTEAAAAAAPARRR